jgi:hypothetical protein
MSTILQAGTRAPKFSASPSMVCGAMRHSRGTGTFACLCLRTF